MTLRSFVRAFSGGRDRRRTAALKTPPVAPAFALPARPQEQRWLVTDLWSADAVGIVGGEPNCCKSTPAIDLGLVSRNDVLALQVLISAPLVNPTVKSIDERITAVLSHVRLRRGLTE